MKVAALFVATGGVYFGLPDVDPWDEPRDARLYDGPHPVVAHPPCQLWVNFAALNYKRYGGEHNRPGNDGGCFEHALATVRRRGGVLEHPAFSNAWAAFDLHRPTKPGWNRAPHDGLKGVRELTCEVWQSAYGHPARKRTWLLYVGDCPPPEMRWERNPGTHQVGWFDRKKPTLSKKAASATPPEFRDALIALARSARRPRPDETRHCESAAERACLSVGLHRADFAPWLADLLESERAAARRKAFAEAADCIVPDGNPEIARQRILGLAGVA